MKFAYSITKRGEKTYWSKIGVAFENRDGSITVKLEAFPVSGELQIRDDDSSRRPARPGGYEDQESSDNDIPF